MSNKVEFRKYLSILELSFDFERILKEDIKDLYYNFHRDTFNDGTVRPYAIKYVNSAGKKITLLFEDILSTLHYIPAYMLTKPITADFGYVSISNEVKVIPSSSQLALTLTEMYTTSQNQEMMLLTDPIADATIATVRSKLDEFLVTYTEDDNFIHLNGDVHISKKLFPSKLANVIIPTNVVEYDDEYICIGYFVIYNGKNVNRRSDITLAIISICNECGTSMIINYEQGTVCPECGTLNTI